MTFAFLGDEIYIKAGAEIPSRRHYGNYPQIEDGVGMVRSFLNAFEKMLDKSEPPALAGGRTLQRSTYPRLCCIDHVMMPLFLHRPSLPPAHAGGSASILTGEMFAPILREQIDKYNALSGSRLNVVAVPNTYFGGDVSVAGLLTGQDLLAMKDHIVGDFVVIPKSTIKSDEPIFLDGMTYDELRKQFPVPDL